MDSVRERKERLRKQLLDRRRQVPPDLRDQAALSVARILQALPEYRHSFRIAATVPFRGEIDSTPILEGILKAGKKLYLPRVPSDRSCMTFHELLALKDLSPGSFGIPEPPPGRPLPPDELDFVLVPGLAFSEAGHRLGFGAGYYDRLIPELRPGTPAVGLCYSFQVLPEVPVDTHDVPVKALLTEKGYTPCR